MGVTVNHYHIEGCVAISSLTKDHLDLNHRWRLRLCEKDNIFWFRKLLPRTWSFLWKNNKNGHHRNWKDLQEEHNSWVTPVCNIFRNIDACFTTCLTFTFLVLVVWWLFRSSWITTSVVIHVMDIELWLKTQRITSIQVSIVGWSLQESRAIISPSKLPKVLKRPSWPKTQQKQKETGPISTREQDDNTGHGVGRTLWLRLCLWMQRQRVGSKVHIKFGS
jgi:hypothetical protein